MEKSPHHLTSVNSTSLFKKGEKSKGPGGKQAAGERSKFGAGDRSTVNKAGDNSKRGDASRRMSKLLQNKHNKKISLTLAPSPAESRMQEQLKISKHHTQDSRNSGPGRHSSTHKRPDEILDTEILQKTIDQKSMTIYRSNLRVTQNSDGSQSVNVRDKAIAEGQTSKGSIGQFVLNKPPSSIRNL